MKWLLRINKKGDVFSFVVELSLTVNYLLSSYLKKETFVYVSADLYQYNCQFILSHELCDDTPKTNFIVFSWNKAGSQSQIICLCRCNRVIKYAQMGM